MTTKKNKVWAVNVRGSVITWVYADMFVSAPPDATEDEIIALAEPLFERAPDDWTDADDISFAKKKVEDPEILETPQIEPQAVDEDAHATLRRGEDGKLYVVGEEGLELVAEEKPTGGRLPPTEVAERWLSVLHDHMSHLERHYRRWLTFRDAPPDLVPAGANHGVVIAGDPGALLAVVTGLWTATENASECWHNRGDEEDD
jgi:hypothetical protein